MITRATPIPGLRLAFNVEIEISAFKKGQIFGNLRCRYNDERQKTFLILSLKLTLFQHNNVKGTSIM